MCDFISWIDYSGKTYFLTDKEVFSDVGNLVFEGCRDNDVLGHGAIRKYYDLPEKAGTDYEVRDFWNAEKYPKVIQNLLKDGFLKHWGKMFVSGKFMNDDLRYIVVHATPKYKDLASKQLLQQNPSNSDLRYIVEYATPKYKDLARYEAIWR